MVNGAHEPLPVQLTYGTAHDSRVAYLHMEPMQDLDWVVAADSGLISWTLGHQAGSRL